MLEVLLFLPSVTFGIVAAEIFPWALFYALINLRTINTGTFALIVLFVLSATATLVFSALSIEHANSDIIRSLVAYLNIILVFYCVVNLPENKILNLVKISNGVFCTLIVIGILQYSSLLVAIDSILSFLTPRASGGALSDQGGRGVTLLSSEPARAGIELSFLYMIFRTTKLKLTTLNIIDFLFIIYILIVIRSASAAAFTMFVIMIMTMQSYKSAVLWIVAIVISPAVQLLIVDSRVGILISSLNDFGSMVDVLFFVANESGHRLLALFSFVKAGLYYPFGFGIGGWRQASIQALQLSGVDYSQFRYFQIWGGGNAISVRAPGVLPNLMLDMGILGTGYFLFWMRETTRRFVGAGIASIILILLVKITLFGSLGNPIPWVVSGLLLRWKHQKNKLIKLNITGIEKNA